MWILQAFGIALLSNFISCRVVDNSVSNPNFVATIFKYNSADENINDVTVRCLGALVHPHVLVTSGTCNLSNKTDDYRVGVFDWSNTLNGRPRNIAVSKVNKQYFWVVANDKSKQGVLEGFSALELDTPVYDERVKIINLPNLDKQYDGEYIRFHVNKDMELMQKKVVKVHLDQCKGAINTEKYKSNVVNCLHNAERTGECVAKPGSPVVYGKNNNNKIDYYLSGLILEGSQCYFVSTNYGDDAMEWLKNVITFYSHK